MGVQLLKFQVKGFYQYIYDIAKNLEILGLYEDSIKPYLDDLVVPEIDKPNFTGLTFNKLRNKVFQKFPILQSKKVIPKESSATFSREIRAYATGIRESTERQVIDGNRIVIITTTPESTRIRVLKNPTVLLGA
jgi:hypothetical protein